MAIRETIERTRRPRIGGRGSARRAAGFSLTEMLVVVGIVVVMVGLLIPALESARRSARTTHCLSNLSQIGKGLHAYLADQVYFPPGDSGPQAVLPSGEVGGYSPQVLLLSYLQATSVSTQIRREHAWSHADNAAAASIDVPALLCPSDAAKRIGPYGRTSYRANIGVRFSPSPPMEDPFSWKREGVFAPGWRVELEDVRDGASVTAAFSEHGLGDSSNLRTTSQSDYYRVDCDTKGENVREQLLDVNPKDRRDNVYSQGGAPMLASSHTSSLYSHDGLPGELSGRLMDTTEYVSTAKSFHGRGANLLLCDGSVRWVKQEIDAGTWRALATYQADDKVDSY